MALQPEAATAPRCRFNAGPDVHVVGSLMRLAPAVGCVVVKPDGTRVLARVERDPLAQDGQD